MKKNKKLIVLIVLIFTALTMNVLAKPYRISGDCMEPAILDGKLYFVNKLSPYLRALSVGDIVVFTYQGKDWVSRVIALGKDEVHLREGSILVNNSTTDSSKIKRNWSNWSYGTYAINKPCKIPSNHIFVLSDNLDSNHDDSRVFGPIHSSKILGFVW